jgi:hypothetical protein
MGLDGPTTDVLATGAHEGDPDNWRWGFSTPAKNFYFFDVARDFMNNLSVWGVGQEVTSCLEPVGHTHSEAWAVRPRARGGKNFGVLTISPQASIFVGSACDKDEMMSKTNPGSANVHTDHPMCIVVRHIFFFRVKARLL